MAVSPRGGVVCHEGAELPAQVNQMSVVVVREGTPFLVEWDARGGMCGWCMTAGVPALHAQPHYDAE